MEDENQINIEISLHPPWYGGKIVRKFSGDHVAAGL